MIKCSICPDKFIQGKICINCGKAYCEKESVSKCRFCKSKLIKAYIKEETFDGNLLQWLIIGASKIGLVDFEEIPYFIPKFILSKEFKRISERIVIFPSKKSSWKFAKNLMKRCEISFYEYERRYDKSRYMIIYNTHKKERWILLNLGAIDHEFIDFLLSFILKVFSQLPLLRRSCSNFIRQAFSKTLFNYVHKLGIPFVYVDEFTLKLARELPNRLAQVYAEY